MFTLSKEEQRYLLAVARNSIATALAVTEQQEQVPSSPLGVTEEHLGAFVTLHRNGALRGCIGHMIGERPLHETVFAMARAAAFEDRRFQPLHAEEWPSIHIEISVLGPLTVCPSVEQIEIGRHGLLLHLQGRQGVFLPQVPVEQQWDVPTYLAQLCRKAGLPPQSHQHSEARLFWYEAFVFS